MAKKDLFKEAVELGLIPEGSVEKDFTVAKLEKILKDNVKDEVVDEEEEKEDVTPKEKSIFDIAVEEKAIPVGAKRENYTDEMLEVLVKGSRKALAKAVKNKKDNDNSNKKK